MTAISGRSRSTVARYHGSTPRYSPCIPPHESTRGRHAGLHREVGETPGEPYNARLQTPERAVVFWRADARERRRRVRNAMKSRLMRFLKSRSTDAARSVEVLCGAYINMRTVTTGKDVSARRYEYFWCSPGTYPDVGTRGRAFVPPNSMVTIHGVSPHIIGFSARDVVRVSGAGRRFGVVEDGDGDGLAGATVANRREIWGDGRDGVGRYVLIISSLSGVGTGMGEYLLGFP